MKKIFLLLFIGVLLSSCARVGSPIGGVKDTIPPRVVHYNIDTVRVNVPRDLKELRIYFDEYITLKDIQKNLIISPSLKLKKILPTTLGNKFVSIQWEGDLKENTTYNFNFGNAIADLNEGNVLPYYNFAFSTGNQLDELYISGEVFDGMMKKSPESTTSQDKKNYVVGLYQESDSINYKAKPYYITKADPDGYFELNYLSPGKYRILAFDDENQNSIFDEGKEMVAFRKEAINLESNISGLEMKLFPNKKAVKYIETKEQTGGVLMLFEGSPDRVEISPINEKLKHYKITHKSKSDSVNIWFDAVKEEIGIAQSENLKFRYNADGKEGEASVFYRWSPKNEMVLANKMGSMIPPNQYFEIVSNYPLEKIQPEKWNMKMDSVTVVPFTAKISEKNPLKLLISSQFEIGKKYTLTIPKETVSSYFKDLEKSYQFNFEVDKAENYGSFVLNLKNKPNSKFWIQFLNEKNEVAFSIFTDQENNEFRNIKPDKYSLRILVDNNGNGYWDASDFSNFTFAEEVHHFPKTIEIRPLWENRESWDLQTNITDTPALLEAESIAY